MSLFTKKRSEAEVKPTKKFKPTDGLHNAIVVGVEDLGMVDQESDDGSKYKVQKFDIIFAVEETNFYGDHMIVKRTVSYTFSENSALTAINKATKWEWDGVDELLGKTCKVLTTIVKTKAGKDYPKVANILEGTGFKSTGKVVLPFWYNDVKPESLLMLKGITVGAKAVKHTPIQPQADINNVAGNSIPKPDQDESSLDLPF